MSSLAAAIPLALHDGDLPRLRPLLPLLAAIWDRHAEELAPARSIPAAIWPQVTPFASGGEGEVPILVLRPAGNLSAVALDVWRAASAEMLDVLAAAGITATALPPVRRPQHGRG